MKKVAVILSGCGVFDGAEIHEAVISLLALARQGATVQCFAPDVPQLHVINHLTGEVSEGESRNVLVEAARICRGQIRNVAGCGRFRCLAGARRLWRRQESVRLRRSGRQLPDPARCAESVPKLCRSP